jgi:peptidoglycan/xylan/chitin deacetylase (PgdA/CDA1 family)
MADTLALCYHAVSPTFPAHLSVRPEALRAQLGVLARRGYRGVTLTDAVKATHDGRRVAVTFDDAFASVAELARPILDELGWPGTVYAVSDFAADGRPLAWDGVEHWARTEHADELRSLDWPALRDLAAAGWEVGSHTRTHPRLTTLDDPTLDEELTTSKAAIEEALGRPCVSIAYPYGDVDARVVQAARRAGYRTGSGLPARWTPDTPLDHPRIGVYHPDDLRRFRVKTSTVVRRVRILVGV